MDPNETLKEQLYLAHSIIQLIDKQATREEASGHGEEMTLREAANLHQWAWQLAERVEALDEWLKRGGFLPKAWER